MNNNKDGLGDRMKSNYESRNRHYLMRRTPVIIRLDGKAFHTFTRSCQKPFDNRVIYAVRYATRMTAERIQGCVAAYTQSDEASFLLSDWATHETQAWFDYNKSKIESIAASYMSVFFNQNFFGSKEPSDSLTDRYAIFDARSFNLPKEEVTNYFLWRGKDWVRNSVNMLGQSLFSHNELQNKNVAIVKEMCMDKGYEWDSLADSVKYGSFYIRNGSEMKQHCPEPTWENINALIETHLNENDSN
jgi:tRNA(His) 5'-end guanylyltransferase